MDRNEIAEKVFLLILKEALKRGNFLENFSLDDAADESFRAADAFVSAKSRDLRYMPKS